MRVSVLPDVGSELPAESDEATMVCTALVDVLPVMLDEHSLMCDSANQDVVSTDVCGDD